MPPKLLPCQLIRDTVPSIPFYTIQNEFKLRLREVSLLSRGQNAIREIQNDPVADNSNSNCERTLNTIARSVQGSLDVLVEAHQKIHLHLAIPYDPLSFTIAQARIFPNALTTRFTTYQSVILFSLSASVIYTKAKNLPLLNLIPHIPATKQIHTTKQEPRLEYAH
jgi:hypothetical protein